MYQGIRYTLLLIVLALLQSLVFNQVQISVYFNPLIYVAFVMLLPMRTQPIIVLMCGLLVGVLMDVTMGLAGVNTIASLLTAYLRPLMLRLVMGRDNAVEGGIPAPMQVGVGKFISYASVFTLVQSVVFFALEAMTLRYAHLIAIKVVLNTAVTVALVMAVAAFFAPKNYNNSFLD
ncbi:MAG: rod shape-determining protein MreD [Rikenellaceae bacterium]|nr:rod shape-determining protein MreD [Rikenellaceae bacterium]